MTVVTICSDFGAPQNKVCQNSGNTDLTISLIPALYKGRTITIYSCYLHLTDEETEAPAGVEMFAHGHTDGLWQGCNLHLLLLFNHKVVSGSLQPQGL